jgi:hypothetical protein
VPILTVSPYSVPGQDPGANPLLGILGAKTLVQVDHVPAPNMGNSRWGVRTQTVVARDYTVSAWIYTAFPNSPVPRMAGVLRRSATDKALVVETVHELVPVIGASNTFYFQPLNGIIRMEAEYFNREPGFIPQRSLPTDQQSVVLCGGKLCKIGQYPVGGSVPRADFLRWELGFDRFFFARFLNPTNSFTWVTAFVGSYNMDETHKKDFYYAGQQRAGTSGQNPSDFVQLKKVDMFAQTHLQTDYLHGRLSPGVTVIANATGSWVVPLQLTYRWSDAMIFDLYYTALGGAFSGSGFFRDRDQLAIRATVQLN